MASVFKRTYGNGSKAETYTAKFRGPNGLFKTIGAYRDHDASSSLAKRLQTLSDKRAAGEYPNKADVDWLRSLLDRIQSKVIQYKIVDPSTLGQGQRLPLDEHLDAFIADLETIGRDDVYCYNMRKRLEKLIAECGWKTAADITAASFTTWRSRYKGKLAARTLGQYFEMARAFMNWCVTNGRMNENPIAQVTAIDDTVKKRKRRAFTLEELDRLIKVAGPRAILYRTTLYCQLRRADVASLRWCDVHLDVLPPYLVTRAETSKGKRTTRHPIRLDLANDLQTYRPEHATDSDKVFPAVPTMTTFKADLKQAGIEYTDADGRQADFHSLGRQTPNTMMANVGVAPRIAMELMRHTDIKLTTGVYTDSSMLLKNEAVEALPVIGGEQEEAQVLSATGSDGRPLHQGIHQETGNVRDMAGTNRQSLGQITQGRATGGSSHNILKNSGLRGKNKMRMRGLEPPRDYLPLGPEPSASANSATSACGLGESPFKGRFMGLSTEPGRDKGGKGQRGKVKTWE